MRGLCARPLLVFAIALVALACGGGGGGGGGGSAGPLGFRVISVDPPDGSYFVALDSEVRATFSDPVYVGRISESNFLVSLRSTGERVPGTVHLESGNQTAVFTPAADFLYNSRYEVRIFAEVINIAREPLGEDFVSQFTTAVNDNPPPPPPPPVENGTFRRLDPMAVGRSSHQATLLTDGRVVVFGGFNTSSSVTMSVEIFDPVTETFAAAPGTLGMGRAFHSATRLLDGRVLIVGGVGGAGLQETSSAEIFDPTTGRCTPTGAMNNPRAFHSATLLPNGRVLIAGGTVPTPSGTYSSRTAEIYDPQTAVFTTLPDMDVYRASHSATLLVGGKVLIAGGNSTSKVAELFDYNANTFTTLAREMKMVRRGHTATRIYTGDVFFMGGEGLSSRTAEIYEYEGETFRTAATYPVKHRKDHTANTTVDGWILLTGGSRTEGSNTFFNQTTEQYKPQFGTFISSSPMLDIATTRHRGTTLEDGRILITGGSNIDWTLPELDMVAIFEKASE